MNNQQAVLRSLIIVGVVAFVLLAGNLYAAVPPRSAEGLFADADVVVVAEVTDLSMRKQRSRIEQGFGNYDWDIKCSLRIKEVEKGTINQGDEIAAHCFAIDSRKSAMEYLSLQGHSPIPEIGQSVRAYLREKGGEFSVLHPNGFAAVDGDTLNESAAVLSGGFTYLLPLELWILAAIVVFGAWVVIRMIRFIKTRHGLHRKALPAS